ncbi:carboxymuconolactone decarboxylase family protein [Micromonospora sp. NPDC003944]
MGRLLARATRRTTFSHIRYVRPVAPSAARGVVAQVYRQLAAEFGMLAPPVVLHSPVPDLLAASWVLLRETLLARGTVPRRAREVVAAAVSAGNRCPYCVDVHGATVAGLGGPGEGARIAGLGIDGVTDPHLRALGRWARGDSVLPTCSPAERSELVGVAVAFHYLNRMVNVFLRDSPLPPTPPPARGVTWWVASHLMGALAAGDGGRPGDSLLLLPATSVPVDLAWARGQPAVAQALARAGQVVDDLGAEVVPDQVRQLVRQELAARPGFTAPLHDHGWLEDAVRSLPAAERTIGRLALLTAIASYRVSGSLMDQARSEGHDDRALLAVTAWASLTAARHAGSALNAGAGPPGVNR